MFELIKTIVGPNFRLVLFILAMIGLFLVMFGSPSLNIFPEKVQKSLMYIGGIGSIVLVIVCLI